MSIIKNLRVYGIGESIQASKYPMSTDVDKLNGEVTNTVKALATSERGSGHDQFLTGIVAQFDLTLSNKAWVEAERYHFLDFVSSQSTMHRIMIMDIAAQCNEYVERSIIDLLRIRINEYKENPSSRNFLRVIYNIPSGFMLTARMTTNYRQLKTIYAQRKDHRLPEWREFCRWIETLPESWMITGEKHDGI